MPRCWLGGSGVMVASPPVGDRPDRAGGAAACRVDHGGHSLASRYRADLFGPFLIVVVDDLVRPKRADTPLAYRTCRRDDLGASQRAERDQQAAGDSAGSMDQEMITGANVQRVAENLFGGERGYREGGRYLPAGVVRLVGEQRRRRD